MSEFAGQSSKKEQDKLARYLLEHVCGRIAVVSQGASGSLRCGTAEPTRPKGPRPQISARLPNGRSLYRSLLETSKVSPLPSPSRPGARARAAADLRGAAAPDAPLDLAGF